MPGLLMLAIVSLGLPLGGGEELAQGSTLPLPEQEISAGPLQVDVGPAGIGAEADTPVSLGPDLSGLPLGLDTGVALCDGCPGLTIGAGPGASWDPPAAMTAQPEPAPRGWPEEAVAAVRDAPPAALFAGSSLLATLLGAAAWVVRPFGLFSRIEDGDLAAHPLRRQALDFIAANPGAAIQDVRRALGIAWGTAVYHLGRLERAGLVAVRRAGGRRGHWPLGQAPARDGPAPTGAALMGLVREHPGLTQAELAQRAGIGAPAACKHLRRLEAAGLVQAQRSGKARVYFQPGLMAGFAPAAAAAVA